MGKLHCNDPDPAVQHLRLHRPLSLPCWVFWEAFPTPGDIFRPFFWEEWGSQLHEHMHIHAGAHVGRFCPRLFVVQGSAWLLLRGVVCEQFVTESKFGCLSEPVGSGRKTRFWFRLEVQRAFVSQLDYPSIFSREMHAVQRLPGCRQGFSCVCGELVLKTSWFFFSSSFGGWNWCGD